MQEQEIVQNKKHHELKLKRNFIRQQGFEDPQSQSCPLQFSALLFQPRLVGVWAVLGVVFESRDVFLALSATLWWSAIAPAWNPFEWIYNATFGSRPGAFRLGRAPGPRRFAQGMAATFSLGIGILLWLQQRLVAYVLEAIFLIAIAALVFGAFCLGSFVLHLIKGRRAFAKSTLPWGRGAF
jgi:hypothetical protein